jgi:hypothetical protein
MPAMPTDGAQDDAIPLAGVSFGHDDLVGAIGRVPVVQRLNDADAFLPRLASAGLIRFCASKDQP